MNLFVDSSFYISLLRQDDRNHNRAKEALEDEAKQSAVFYTSQYVIDETATVLSMRVSKTSAVAFLNATEEEDFPIILGVDEEVRRQGYAIFREAKDKDISMVDCYCAALMKKHAISKCLTFDKQFTQLGFKIIE
ncbi:MAG: PIN domain-containing protein [bacterium]|nr:PIN domain-containing protein [bacterium]